MRNLLVGLVVPVLLAGCGLPPAVSVATTVAGGFTQAVSGKSVTDHALSAVATDDCSVVRALENDNICTGYGGEEMPRILAASAPGAGSWAQVETSLAADSQSPGSVAGTSAAPAVSVAPSPVAEFAAAVPQPKPAIATSTDPITVLGSYRSRANAERAAVELASLQPRVVVAISGPTRMYRVVSDVPVREAWSAGVFDAWLARREKQVASTL